MKIVPNGIPKQWLTDFLNNFHGKYIFEKNKILKLYSKGYSYNEASLRYYGKYLAHNHELHLKDEHIII